MNKAIIAEPTPQEIKETKLYQQWGLTDEEYQMISEEILGRLPNYTETGLFSVMWSEHCSYKNSKPVLRKFPTEGPQVLQGPGEGAESSILVMAKQLSLKRKVITILRPWSLMKAPQPASVGLFVIFSVWGRGPSRS